MNLPLEILNCIIETLIAFCFFDRFFGRRAKTFAGLFGGFLLFTAVNFARSIINMLVIINLCISYVWLLCIAFSCFKYKPLKLFITTSIYMVILIFTDNIANLVMTFAFHAPRSNGYVMWGAQRYILSVITLFISFILAQPVASLILKKHRPLPLKYNLILIAVPIMSVGSLFATELFLDILSPVSTLHLAAIAYIAASVFVFNIITFDFIDNYYARVRLTQTEELIKMQEENYRMLEINEQELRILRHDLRGHMEMLRKLYDGSDNARVNEYLAELEDFTSGITEKVYTGDLETDSALNIERKRALAAGVKYTVSTQIFAPIRINKLDKTTLLCNIISNAVEGCRNSEDKFVSVSIVSTDDRLKITTENSSTLDGFSGGYLPTTKHDRLMHGFGIPSIQNIASHYNGSFDMRCTDGIMVTAVVLENKQI